MTAVIALIYLSLPTSSWGLSISSPTVSDPHQLSEGKVDVSADLARLTALFTDSRGGWDKDHDQDAKCANPGCGHSYERHFDTYADMEPVGCKYCGPVCPRFVESPPKR